MSVRLFIENKTLRTRCWNQARCRVLLRNPRYRFAVRSKSKLLLLLTVKLEVKVINQCNPRGCVFNRENAIKNIRAWELSRELNVYGAKEGEQGKLLYETIIFSYEKFKVRSSRNINHVKVASKKVLSANLAYANTSEQSG